MLLKDTETNVIQRQKNLLRNHMRETSREKMRNFQANKSVQTSHISNYLKIQRTSKKGKRKICSMKIYTN